MYIIQNNARDINYFTKKNLQTADMVSDYWQMKKVILVVGLNENQ